MCIRDRDLSGADGDAASAFLGSGSDIGRCAIETAPIKSSVQSGVSPQIAWLSIQHSGYFSADSDGESPEILLFG